jgi:rod shape determining protein RodA
MDFVLLGLVLSLLVLGTWYIDGIGDQVEGAISLYSAKQVQWIVIGLVMVLALACFDYEVLGGKVWWIYSFGMLLLVAVLIFGTVINGQKCWIDFGAFTIQPAELAKPCCLLALAWIASRPRTRLKELGHVAPVAAVAALPMALIGLQPDMGSALIFVPMTATVMYFAGIRKRYLLVPLATGVLLAPAIYFILKPHQRDRIDTFTHPFVHPVTLRMAQKKAAEMNLSQDQMRLIARIQDPLDYVRVEEAYRAGQIKLPEYKSRQDPKNRKTVTEFLANEGWQAWQSKLAVSSGGLWGKGHGNSTQVKLGFLSKGTATTDCLVAVIAEEGGFAMMCLILLLEFGVIICCARIAMSARDTFGRAIAMGCGSIFLMHTYINVGMAIGYAPVIGIPLPFVSYGGSFILSSMICVGLLQCVHVRRDDDESKEKLSELMK